MKFWTIAIFAVFISGCSLNKKQEIALSSYDMALESQDLDAPLLVKVIKASQEDGFLRVTAQVEAAVDFIPANAVVGVVGLKDGQEITRYFTKLSNITAKRQLRAKDVLTVPLEINAKDLTEFQLRCLWGEEAMPIIASIDQASTARASLAREKNPSTASSDPFREAPIDPVEAIISESTKGSDKAQSVGLQGVKMTITGTKEQSVSCIVKPCDILYTLVAELENNGPAMIDSAKVAVGLFWANAGALPVVPADGDTIRDIEQEIGIDRLSLFPGHKKQLEIKVDRPVPPVHGGGFVPNVRLLSVSK